MVRPLHACVGLLAVLAGCAEPGEDFLISNEWMIAGQRLTFRVFDDCAGGARADRPCLRDEVTGVVRAEIGPPFTLENTWVESGVARIQLHAEREGDSLLTVTVLNKDGGERTVSQRMFAKRVDEAHLVLSGCSADQTPPPFLVPANRLVGAQWFLLAEGRKVRADGYFPFEAPGVTFSPSDQEDALFIAPATLTAFTITSPADPDFRMELETYDATSIPALRLEPYGASGALRVGSSVEYFVHADYARKPCRVMDLPVRVTTGTPSICDATDQLSLGSGFLVRGMVPGTCRFTAQLEGGSASRTVELTVAP